MKIRKALAQKVDAYHACVLHGNDGWAEAHLEVIEGLVQTYMPHGSGIDADVELSLDESDHGKLVFDVPYHYMNEVGHYAGWMEFSVVARASFALGLMMDVEVIRNNSEADEAMVEYIADAIAEVFAIALQGDLA